MLVHHYLQTRIEGGHPRPQVPQVQALGCPVSSSVRFRRLRVYLEEIAWEGSFVLSRVDTSRLLDAQVEARIGVGLQHQREAILERMHAYT